MLVRRTDLVFCLEPHQLAGDLDMTRIQPLLAATWWLVMTGWVAALIAPGAAAMSAFTALPALGVEVPAYAAFFADDPDGAARLAAGFVTYPIFLVADRMQLVFAGLAVLLVVVGRGIPCGDRGFGQRLVSSLALLSALGCLTWYLLFVAPALATSLDAWRAAALADAGVLWMERPVGHTGSCCRSPRRRRRGVRRPAAASATPCGRAARL